MKVGDTVYVGATWCRLVELVACVVQLSAFDATWLTSVQLGADSCNVVQAITFW